jgi:hypothetical protein
MMISKRLVLITGVIIAAISTIASGTSIQPDLQMVGSLICSIKYKADEADASKIVLELSIKNSSDKPVSIDLDGFPKLLIFNPKNQDPLDSSGISPDKLALPSVSMHKVIIEGGREFSQSISIPRPPHFLDAPPQDFKLQTLATYVDNHGHSTTHVITSFFLVGKLSQKAF